MDRGTWQATVHGITKNQKDMTEAAEHTHKSAIHSVGKESACNAGDLVLIPGSGRSLEEGHGTHSSILAWRIPWTEEPGGLQSMGSQRVKQIERPTLHFPVT